MSSLRNHAVALSALWAVMGAAHAATDARRRFGAAIPAGAVGEQGGAPAAGLGAQAPRAAGPSQGRRAERADHPARRRRLRPGIDVRRRDEHTHSQQAREPGRQLQHLSHHGDLFADAGGVAHRAQSPAGRQRHHRRARGRLGRLHRRDPEDFGDDGRGAASLRLQDGGIRQMAQHAGRPDHGDGPVRPLAHRARLRLLLRLPRRRDLAVGAAAGREHERHRAAARREVPPDRGHGAAEHRLAAQAPRVLAGQAVLHVLGARRGARAASGRQGMVRQVQGQVRRRLGCLPRARVRAPEAAGLDSGRHQADAARAEHGVVGQHSGGPAAVPAPADGDLRRLRRARRRAGRQAGRRARAAGRARQHDRHLHLRRQRRQRRRAERHHQRAAGAERHPQHGRAADRGAGEDRRSRRAGRPQDRQHVPRRMGVGRQHAVPPHQAGRLALRRHAQPDGHLLAEGHQGRQDTARAVPPRQRHRADDLRGRRHQAAQGGRRLRAGPDGRRESCLHLHRRQGAHAQEGPVFRQQRQPRASTRTAGWRRRSGR